MSILAINSAESRVKVVEVLSHSYFAVFIYTVLRYLTRKNFITSTWCVFLENWSFFCQSRKYA